MDPVFGFGSHGFYGQNVEVRNSRKGKERERERENKLLKQYWSKIAVSVVSIICESLDLNDIE
jgi:hypothetical protein